MQTIKQVKECGIAGIMMRALDTMHCNSTAHNSVSSDANLKRFAELAVKKVCYI